MEDTYFKRMLKRIQHTKRHVSTTQEAFSINKKQHVHTTFYRLKEACEFETHQI